MKIAWKKLTSSAKMPERGSAWAAGYDLFADVIENKMETGLNLLKKALTNKSLYRPELKLRNQLLSEEMSILYKSA